MFGLNVSAFDRARCVFLYLVCVEREWLLRARWSILTLRLRAFCGWEGRLEEASELERRFCLSLRPNRPFEHLDFVRIACRVVFVISIVIASFYHHHRFTHLSSPQPFLLLSQTRRLSPSRDVLSKKSVSTPS